MAKAKVSVTVDRALQQKCDRAARGASRSEAFERALERWLLPRLSEPRTLNGRGPRASSARRDLGANPNPLRGCLYWVVIPGEPGDKGRPALVVSVDARNRLASDVLVIPASTTLRVAPTHVRLRKGTAGIRMDSVLKCE